MASLRGPAALAILDWFVPEPLRSDHDLRLRGRLLAGISILSVGFGASVAAWAYLYAPGMSWTVVTVVVACALLAVNPFLLRARREHVLPGVLLCVEAMSALILLAYLNSGVYSASLLWVLPMPLVAHIVVGPRFGTMCGLAAVGVIGAFYSLSELGFEFPSQLDAEQTRRWHVVGLLVGVGFLALVGWLYELARRDTNAEHARSMAKIEHARRKLQQSHDAMMRYHERLRDAQVELVERETLASIGQVAAGVAHELRNPLNGIKVIAQCALREAELGQASHEELEEDLREVVTLTDSASSIIDDIRSSTDNTDRTRRLVPVSAEAELLRAVRLLTRELRRADICVHQDMADVPPVSAEPGRLQQIFLNLLQNAVDALTALDPDVGGRAIWLGVQCGKRPDEVEVTVRDNGGGIPDEVRERMYEPFFTTKPVGQGSGLGLAISRRLAAQCGGRIACDAEPGVGTTFSITLPLWQDRADAHRGQHAS